MFCYKCYVNQCFVIVSNVRIRINFEKSAGTTTTAQQKPETLEHNFLQCLFTSRPKVNTFIQNGSATHCEGAITCMLGEPRMQVHFVEILY